VLLAWISWLERSFMQRWQSLTFRFWESRFLRRRWDVFELFFWIHESAERQSLCLRREGFLLHFGSVISRFFFG
jgi:hypothetical protein